MQTEYTTCVLGALVSTSVSFLNVWDRVGVFRCFCRCARAALWKRRRPASSSSLRVLLALCFEIQQRRSRRRKPMIDASVYKSDKHSPLRALFMRRTSGASSQSADNPSDTAKSTDLHNTAPVSRITLIPSSFICPIPCLLSGDMRQETKH